MLYCPNFFWNVLQVWMTGKDVYLQMTWSWPDKTWNILCSYCLQWNTSQSKFRNYYFLFLFAFSILSQLFLIWGCTKLNGTHLNQITNQRRERNWVTGSTWGEKYNKTGTQVWHYLPEGSGGAWLWIGGPPWARRGNRSPLWAGRGNRSPLWAGCGNRSPLWAGRGNRSPLWAGRGNRSPLWAGHGNRSHLSNLVRG